MFRPNVASHIDLFANGGPLGVPASKASLGLEHFRSCDMEAVLQRWTGGEVEWRRDSKSRIRCHGPCDRVGLKRMQGLLIDVPCVREVYLNREAIW